MSNGDSLDGFVFPPFIPAASARPAETPPAPPQPSSQEPAPASEASGRMTMPWDLETPIVREADDVPPAAQAEADEGDDLPWLELPAAREVQPVADEVPAAPAQDEAFPEWLSWDQRDEVAAEAEARDTVAPIAGLEDFAPMEDLGGFVAPPPAAEWAVEESDGGYESDAEFEVEAPSPFGAAAEVDADLVDASGSADEWSLAAPDAAEPPAFDEAPPLAFEESPAGAEPSFEVSVDDGMLTIEPAAAEPAPFVADAEVVIAAEEAPVIVPEAAAPASPETPFDDVAARLESIARMLRERPDELFADGSKDPLALLVTGYVMGYTARGR